MMPTGWAKCVAPGPAIARQPGFAPLGARKPALLRAAPIPNAFGCHGKRVAHRPPDARGIGDAGRAGPKGQVAATFHSDCVKVEAGPSRQKRHGQMARTLR